MSRKQETSFHQFVFSMDSISFLLLKMEVERRETVEVLGAYEMEDLARIYGRKPVCPRCGSEEWTHQGYDCGEPRYECKKCEKSYRLLSQSIFFSSKIEPGKLLKMLCMMTYNAPLDLIAEMLGIHHNTALLWRRKVFETVGGWQSSVRLRGTVWIDEIYTFDWSDPADHKHKGKQGLSGKKIAIALAIDQYKNIALFAIGKGHPTSKSIMACFGDRIDAACVIHDGLMAHRQLIAKLGIDDKVYKSTVKDEESLAAMAMINNFSAWVKRFLCRFSGMRTDEYLQDYLNWFAYIFKVKKQSEIYPKDERLMRHLLLSEVKYTRRNREN